MLLANNLKFLRKRHGYTQSQVALLLEINRSTYAYYELSSLYGVKIDDLLNKDLHEKNV